MGRQRNIKRSRHQDDAKYVLSQEDWDEFERGINYFNDSRFWHAIEAWTLVSERCDREGKQIIKSLIEVANFCQKTNSSDIIKGIDKVTKQLQPYAPEHCGLLIDQLVESLRTVKENIRSADPHRSPLDFCRIRLQIIPPSNPDLEVEVTEICASTEFQHGIRLFNKGYYWEAHEKWEELWRDQSGHGKTFMEIFVQLAEGYTFAKRGKTDSAQYLFGKVIKKFQDYRQVQCKVSIPEIVRDLENAVVEINSFRQNGTSHFSFSSMPMIKLNSNDSTA